MSSEVREVSSLGDEDGGCDDLALNEAMSESLRHMGAYAQRSLKFYTEAPAVRSLVAKKLPPVSNIMIPRANFRTEAVTEYSKVKAGEFRQLVAGTGVGKSTTFPAAICSHTGENGLILSPRADLSYANGMYLQDKFLPSNFPDVQAVRLRSFHAKKPEQGKTLYYDVSSSFFMMLSVHANLLVELNIKFILFDESHESTGDYKLAELLASSGMFSNVKLLLVSATKGSMNMEHEADATQKKVIKVEPKLVDMSAIHTLPTASPIHYSNITGITLVFVPDLKCIAAARRYYADYDIPSYVHTTASSSTGMEKLVQFLDENRVGVILADSVMDTGFTYPYDVAVDCGYTQELVFDLPNQKVELKKVPVTLSTRAQRGGRVGRMKPGTFYFADIESSPPPDDLPDSSACYLALWCQLFNIKTSLPKVRKFKEHFGAMTNMKVMKLLHCHVHPILAHPYMDNQGGMCHGWENVFDRAMRYGKFGSSDVDKSAEMGADWVHQSVYDERFVAELQTFQVPLTVPNVWTPFFYAVWKATNVAGKRWPFGQSDRRSVLTIVKLDPPERRRTWAKPRAGRDSSATLAFAKVDESAARKATMSPVKEEAESLDDFELMSERYSVASLDGFEQTRKVFSKPLPVLPVGNVAKPVIEQVRKPARIDTSVRATMSTVVTPVSGPKLSDYKHVKVKKLGLEKAFPYNVEMIAAYLANPTRQSLDVQRTMNLCSFKVKFHDLNTDMRQRYLVSLIRCWNYNVVSIAQVAAREQNDRPGLFRRISRTSDVMQEDLQKFKSVMSAMELEGFDFAVQRNGRHAAIRQQLGLSSSLADDRVDFVRGCLRIFSYNGFKRGLYLQDGKVVVGVLHVFEQDGAILRPRNEQRFYAPDYDDFVLMFDKDTDDSDLLQLVREPVSGEAVIVVSASTVSGHIVMFKNVIVAKLHDEWFHSASCEPGMSGAALLAADDGKLLGLHKGASSVFPEFPGTMVALHKFVS